jgi:predicted DNA-binding protein
MPTRRGPTIDLSRFNNCLRGGRYRVDPNELVEIPDQNVTSINQVKAKDEQRWISRRLTTNNSNVRVDPKLSRICSLDKISIQRPERAYYNREYLEHGIGESRDFVYCSELENDTRDQ